MRLIPLALAAVVAIGGGLLSWTRLGEIPREHALCGYGFCEAAAATVASEPTNPFSWSDLAESRAAAGDIEGAREAFARSLHFGPNIAPVLIRVVNFEMATGELERTVPVQRHILELTAAYDSVIFRYLVRSRMPLERIQREVIPDPGNGSAEIAAARARAIAAHAVLPDGESRPRGEPARGWVAYLIADRHPEAAKAYRSLSERGGVTAELRNSWIEYLVTVRKEYQTALDEWAASTKQEGYPLRNRIFNARFEGGRPAGRMEWSIAAHAHATAKTGGGLTVTFDGKENLVYGHVSQQTFLQAGRWRFEAEAEADGLANRLTTDQRPFFRIADVADARRLDVSTPMAPERMAVEFTVPAGGSWVSITLQRRQSEKFDNKIAGTLRVKEVRLGQ